MRVSQTYFSIACMFVAVTHLLALCLAQILFAAWQLFGVQSTAAFFLNVFQALATFTAMTSFGTNVIAAFKCFLACISAWFDFYGAWRLSCLKITIRVKVHSNHVD